LKESYELKKILILAVVLQIIDHAGKFTFVLRPVLPGDLTELGATAFVVHPNLNFFPKRHRSILQMESRWCLGIGLKLPFLSCKL